MDCYIVRIYRKEAGDPGSIVGLVETVGRDGQESFRSSEELLAILDTRRTRSAGAKKRRSGETRRPHAQNKGGIR